MNQEDSFFKSPFAPLGRVYCDYFFWLSVINFIVLLYILFSVLFTFLFDKKKQGILQIFLISLPTFLGYFTNRLLYSMCVGTTQM
jgi:hypothetical protein